MTRAAAILIPLFSLNDEADCGRGEILSLIPFSELALAMGHRVVQLLPLGETSPSETSPYSALSVFAIDPLYISLSALAGLSREAARARDSLGLGTGRERATLRRISREQLRAAKLPLLRRAFARFRRRGGARERAALERFTDENRGWLHDYALFRALKERLEWSSWESWPQELRDRDPAAIDSARRELASEIAMYSYWQFVAHSQWQRVRDHARTRGALLGGDLSFSPARDSAEVWANRDLFRFDRLIGTPPDAFSEKGQRWGLPMPDWQRMREDGFAWWRMRIRHARRLYDLFRIDHVVGLYRTFSFPADSEDAPGSFTPADEPAQLAQGEAFIKMVIEEAGVSALIAEDLGTVPPWVRASLTALGIPGYKVVRWEKNWDTAEQNFIAPATYLELSVATTGTHDTETLAEWWRETTLRDRMMLTAALSLTHRIDPRRRILDLDMLDAILEALYASPSRLVITPIQDLFAWTARINRPGTVGPQNWTWRLPLPLSRLRASGAVATRAARLRAIAERTNRFAAPV